MDKTCKNCAHSRNRMFDMAFATCHAPQNSANNPVSGKKTYRSYTFCSNQRRAVYDACGNDGKWFTPKTTLWQRFLGTKGI